MVPASDTCESCGSPKPAGQKLCVACTSIFGGVLDPAPADAAPAPPEPAVATPTGPFQQTVDAVQFDGDGFAAAPQPWERKGDAVDPAATNADDQEPTPWWERKADAGATSHAAPAAPAHAPSESGGLLVPPPIPVQAATLKPRVDAPQAARVGPRPVPRPPTPGVTTRPAPRQTDRRGLVVLAASAVVLIAVGVPTVRSWMRPNPTVTADLGEFAADPAPDATPKAAPAAATARPVARPEPTPAVAEAPPPTPSPRPATPARAETTPARTRPEPARHVPVRGERPAHSILARQTPAASPTTRVFLPNSGAAAEPAPEPVAAAAAPVASAPEPIVEAPIGQVFEMGQVDDKPRVATQVEPAVPVELRDRPLTDLVILRVLVSQSGRPSDVNLLRRSKAGAALDNAVVAAVRQWSFEPARKRGQAVNCWYNVGVPLRLDGASP